ncbi:hypothetical protein ACFFSW_02605 [Saccharothrix longispora]|uniref:Uncharacterized protein n=1 Tax=Saccharothrix longispora TaxID=33920 RepID=A0ABU1PW59_9PSEU|nr:hypothetical protein [Saccharothrix longispora]MDR6594878.1 hypothetical protein [Saccharothrix longispora]
MGRRAPTGATAHPSADPVAERGSGGSEAGQQGREPVRRRDREDATAGDEGVEHGRPGARERSPLRDGPYLAVTAATAALSLCWAMLSTGLPLLHLAGEPGYVAAGRRLMREEARGAYRG